MTEPRYLTVSEVAELARMSESTIRHYRSTGTGGLPRARKIGTHIRFRYEEVLDWLEGRTAPEGPEAV